MFSFEKYNISNDNICESLHFNVYFHTVGIKLRHAVCHALYRLRYVKFVARSDVILSYALQFS